MKWYVYRYNINRQAIEKYNIFNHGGFSQSIQKFANKEYNRNDFDKELENILFYNFWRKTEHEIYIASDEQRGNLIKVDIFEQVMLNFEKFADYMWGWYLIKRMYVEEEEEINSATEEDIENILEQIDSWGIDSLTEMQQTIYYKFINGEL